MYPDHWIIWATFNAMEPMWNHAAANYNPHAMTFSVVKSATTLPHTKVISRAGMRRTSRNTSEIQECSETKKEGAAKAYKQNSSISATVAFNPRRDAVFLRLLLGISNPTLKLMVFCLVLPPIVFGSYDLFGAIPSKNCRMISFQNWFFPWDDLFTSSSSLAWSGHVSSLGALNRSAAWLSISRLPVSDVVISLCDPNEGPHGSPKTWDQPSKHF